MNLRNWTGSQSIFGTLGGHDYPYGTNVDFIPKDSNGNVIDIRDTDAVWRKLGTPQMQYWAYKYCSPLASVIDRFATSDVNGSFSILRKSVKRKGSPSIGDDDYSNSYDSKRVKNLFIKPNPLQDYHSWRAQQILFKKNFGFTLVYFMGMLGTDFSTAKMMWNLDPLYCTPVENPNFNPFDENNSNPIKEWTIEIFGKQYTIPAEKILILRDSFMPRDIDRFGLPMSKVCGLEWSISNICAAMEADNVLLRKKGPLGFISQDSTKDPVAGALPLSPSDKKEVQDDLSNYGLTWSQWQYVVTRHGLRWNPMSFKVTDLDTKGTIKEAIDMICDRFGFPAELMSGKNATYENRTSAERYFYNSCVIPENIRDMSALTMALGLENDYLYCDFSDYPALQDNRVKQGEGQKYLSEGLLVQFQSKVITLNQMRQALDWDTVEGDDIYYNSPEYIKKYGKDEDNAPKSSGKEAE